MITPLNLNTVGASVRQEAPSALSDPSDASWGFWPGLAYAAACLLLVLAFNGEHLTSLRVGILDWPKELFYYHFLRGSLLEFGELPASFFVIPDSLRHFSTLQDQSFWNNPETPALSPFYPLLWLMPTVVFLKAFFAGHYILAIFGVGLLARRLGFTPLEGVCLFLLLTLNPWVSQHLAIGYSPSVNALLFPLAAALLLTPGPAPWNLALAAAVNAMIFYQGALHLFVWFNVAALAAAALGSTVLRSPAPLLRVSWFQLLSFALVFPKYWSVSKAYADFQRVPGTGYDSLANLWGLLTDASSPLFDFPDTYHRYGVAFYDASLYVGQWFLLLLAGCLAAWVTWGRGRRGGFPACWCWVALACAILFLVLGWGSVWRRVTNVLTLLRSEIYPFRWLYMAYLFAAVFVMGMLRSLLGLVPGRTARAVLLVALLSPVCWAFSQRNAFFSRILVQEEDIFAGFSTREYLVHRVVAFNGQTLLPATVSPSRLDIVPPGRAGDSILLPWLDPGREKEFDFINLSPHVSAPDRGLAMKTDLANRPASIVARTHHRGRNALIGLGAFLVLVAASAWRARAARRGKRVPGARDADSGP